MFSIDDAAGDVARAEAVNAAARSDGPGWLEYGPAEFDSRRMPRTAQRGDAGQGALFFVPVTPKPVKVKPRAAELPGQVDIFGQVAP